MYVRFWGTRGSIPAPGRQTATYGGNTSCVEVRAADGTLIMLDCGTGARELGLQLQRSSAKPLRLHLFIGHTHWDHIQGFPFFVPAFLPDTELNIYAPVGFQRSLEEAMAGQMQYSYFPVKLHELRSRIHFTELEEGFFRVGDVQVETQYLNHTAPTIAYRISSGGATLAYVTDHEPFWKLNGLRFQHPGDQRHIAFLKGADLVIHDAQYSEEEYGSKVGWGHSPIEYATDVTLAAGVRQLALFHHDPTHDDTIVEQLEARARARVAARGGTLQVFAAAEGLELDVRGNGSTSPVAATSALRRRPIAGGRVLVVTANATDIAAIGQVLLEDGLVLIPAADKRDALERALEIPPDLAIIDRKLSDGDGLSLIRLLRTRLGRRNMPVLLLSEGPDTKGTLRHRDTAPTDYLAKPFSPPMLRTRVRAWLARTRTADSAPMSGALPHRSQRMPALGPSGAADGEGGDGATAVMGYVGLLNAVPIFQSLTPEQLHNLAARASEHVYPGGHIIIRQGEPGSHLYVVLSGRVRVVESASDTPQVELYLGELGWGEVFGELGVLRDQPRSATVIAVEPTRCLVLSQLDFLQALRSSPDLAIALLRVLAGRLYDADRLLARYSPDPLTGLASRRAFHDQYRRLAAGARRRSSGVLLLLLDVLHLRAINDRFGYLVGNDVLCTVADALMETTRSTDLVARYGGDEFAVLLVDARPGAVDLVVGRVQEKLADLASQRGLALGVQCCIGVAVSQAPPETADSLLREADQDMHHQKSAGPRPARRARR